MTRSKTRKPGNEPGFARWYLNRWVLVFVFSGAILLGGNALAARDRLVIKGSTTVLPIVQLIAEMFTQIYPEVEISVQGGGSGVGLASLIDKTSDMAITSRAMKPGEEARATSRGRKLQAHIIALDAIAVIVHPSNPTKNLTRKQLQDLFTGKFRDWSSVNDGGQKLAVISRDSASGTSETFRALALDHGKVRPDALMEASNQLIAATVETSPGAIGYIGLAYITPRVKALSVDGVVPTPGNVLQKKYPLARPLYIYTSEPESAWVKAFVDFVLSEEGQRVVKQAGFVGLR